LPRTAVIRPPGWAPNVSRGSLLEQQVDYELFVHQVRGVGVRRATGCGSLQPIRDRRGRAGAALPPDGQVEGQPSHGTTYDNPHRSAA
jgi:hypothetical protein